MSPGKNNGRLPPDDLDLDEPIQELRGLAVEPSAEFSNRLRHRIQRREASNHVFWVVWNIPSAVILAFLEMPFALLGFGPNDKGGSK